MAYLRGHKHPVDQYLSEINDGLHYYATWFPNLPLNIGDIGTVKNNQFDRESDLKSKGIDFEILKGQSHEDMHYFSKNAVDFYSKAAGKIDIIKQLLGGVDADFAIHFKRENAICLALGNCLTHVIEDQHALAKEIEDRHNDLEWDRDWAVITELVTAKSGLVVISGSKEACVGFNLAGNATIPYTDLTVANAKVGLQLVGGHELFFKSCTCEGITPLFRLCRLQSKKLKIFRKAALTPLSVPTDFDNVKETFTELEFDPQQLGKLANLKWFPDVAQPGNGVNSIDVHTSDRTNYK